MSLATSLDQLRAETVERAAAGERRAIEELLRALQRPVYNLALRMLHDAGMAEDAAQESLLRIVTHLSQFRSEARFSTWATRVAVTAVLDFRGGRGREAQVDFDRFAERLEQGLEPTAIERPEDALLLKQAKTQCGRALLQCLDGNHRIAFVLGDILEFDAMEAGEVLGLEPAAFRKRLSRARADLTAFLARRCSVHTPGASCACHRQVGYSIRLGRIDPAQLSVRIGDLVQLRSRLASLDSEARTSATYQHDETPDLREAVLASVRETLFGLTN